MINVIGKKRTYENVITGKENASKEWNCIISMFLTSFDVYFVFGYACVMCIRRKTAIWLFWLFLEHGLAFWWKQVGNPGFGFFIENLGFFDSGQIFVNVCRITVFSIQEYSSFIGVICAESSVASADVSSRARLNQIVW